MRHKSNCQRSVAHPGGWWLNGCRVRDKPRIGQGRAWLNQSWATKRRCRSTWRPRRNGTGMARVNKPSKPGGSPSNRLIDGRYKACRKSVTRFGNAANRKMSIGKSCANSIEISPPMVHHPVHGLGGRRAGGWWKHANRRMPSGGPNTSNCANRLMSSVRFPPGWLSS